MANASWREEKAASVVESICRVLVSNDLDEDARRELEGEALFNGLKLFAEALGDRLGSNRSRWSPALVEAFRDEPAKCPELLKLMSEPEFSVEESWLK